MLCKRIKKTLITCLAVAGLLSLNTYKVAAKDDKLEYTFNNTLKSTNNQTAQTDTDPQYTKGMDKQAIALNNTTLNLGDIPFTQRDNFTIIMSLRLQNECEDNVVLLTNKDFSDKENPGIALFSTKNGIMASFTAGDRESLLVEKEGAYSQIGDTKWKQVAISVDRNNSMSFYVDSKLVLKTNIANKKDFTIGETNWFAGSDINGNYKTEGMEIDNLECIPNALTEEDISKKYNENWGLKVKENLLEQARNTVEELKTENNKEFLKEVIEKSNSQEDTYIANKMLYSAIETAKEENTKTPDLSFSVFSDYHIFKDEGPNGIYDQIADSLYLSNKGMDTAVHLGDLTGNGYYDSNVAEREYVKNLTDYFDNYISTQVVLGNHETGRACETFDDQSDNCVYERDNFERNMIPLYKEITKQDKLYYDTYVNGYHFIQLNSESPGYNWKIMFSQEQIDWLKDTLKNDKDKSKPIFINIHEPFSNTSDWYIDGYNMGEEADKILKDIFKDYPNAVFLSGHMHNGPESIDIHHQSFGTLLDCPSSRYNEGTGYVINVYGNQVEVRLRDYKRDKWLDKYTKVFEVPTTDVYDTENDIVDDANYSEDKAVLTDFNGKTGITLKPNAEIVLELENNELLAGIKVQSTITADYNVFTNMPKGMKVEVSLDNKNWRLALDTDLPKNCAYHYYNFDSVFDSKYAKITFTEPYEGESINLAELRLVKVLIQENQNQDIETDYLSNLFNTIIEVIKSIVNNI